MNNWKTINLEDCIKLRRGHDLPITNSKGGNSPIYGSSGIIGWHDVVKCKGPGLVLGRSGNSMGKAHYVDRDFWPHNTVMFVTDFLGNSPKFLYYVLCHIDFKKYNSGSAVPSLNRNYIHNIGINLPPLPEQRAIASILSALDDKIELNLQMNRTLEEMAMTLYKHWFVDFGPFKSSVAKAKADENDEFVRSELGEIPKGWEVGELERLFILQ
ncbi:MAG: restriction endonuclease subunit S, partial [Saprospiraceae bacterium]